MQKPRYTHDCDRCEFLGAHKEFDLYFCPGEPTIVCRYGNKGPNYGSGLVFAVSCNEKDQYKEALKLALKTKHRKKIIRYFVKYEKPQFPERWDRFEKILKEVG